MYSLLIEKNLGKFLLFFYGARVLHWLTLVYLFGFFDYPLENHKKIKSYLVLYHPKFLSLQQRISGLAKQIWKGNKNSGLRNRVM